MRALTLFLLWILCANLRAEEIHVFAAASLTDVLQEIARSYEKISGDKVLFNFGASSFLARQIEAGAPCEIFFSADEARMDDLQKKGLTEKETRVSRLSNTLVIVVASDSNLNLTNATSLPEPNVKRIALADPAVVPAGVYAKEYLQKIGLWERVRKKVIPTDNVRAALAAVEAGNVDAAIVYKTDAAISKKTKVTLEVPRDQGPAISYPMAMVKQTRKTDAARKFFEHLKGYKASAFFEAAGFLIAQ
jgi:molybdate transport system substrate-binding protein